MWHQPFDLYFYFVTLFAGSLELFLAIAFLVIASLAGMFRMPPIITGIAFALFIIMLSVVTGNLYILVLFVLALVVGWSIVRFISR